MATQVSNPDRDVVQARLDQAALEQWQRRQKASEQIAQYVDQLTRSMRSGNRRAADQMLMLRRLAAEHGVILS